MKINLAVYTAQEGYSWQPGTAIGLEALKTYKARIGKFPSPDAPDFPFGGVFLEGENVVFYRYHVAKKIDFRGRDALYCVLGIVPKTEAKRLDVKALFALPQFAEVVRPFPTEADVSAALIGSSPEWLRNLDTMSLDVKISGTLDNLKFNVAQEQVKFPEPPAVEKPAAISEGEGAKAKTATAQAQPFVAPKIVETQKSKRPTMEIIQWLPWYLEPHAFLLRLALLVVSMLVVLVLVTVFLIRGCGSQKDEGDQTTAIQADVSQAVVSTQKTQPGVSPLAELKELKSEPSAKPRQNDKASK